MRDGLSRIIQFRDLLKKNSNDFVITPNGQLISVACLVNEIIFPEQENVMTDLFVKNDIIKFVEDNKKEAIFNDEKTCTYENKEALFYNFEKLGRRCLAGGTETIRNKYTAHHDDFARDGGKTTIENISPLLSLEHSAVHILANESYKYKKEIYLYLKELKAKREKLSSLVEYHSATELEIQQFHTWLEEKMYSFGYEPTETKNNTLIYRRSDTRNRM